MSNKTHAVIVQCTAADLYPSLDPEDYCIATVRRAGFDNLLLAVPDLPESSRIEEVAREWDVPVYRGSVYNVAERLLGAAQGVGADIIARVLLKRFYLDTDLVWRMIERVQTGVDYVGLPHDYNYELAADVFATEALARVAASIQGDDFEAAIRRFSPWRYMEEHPQTFRVECMQDLPDYAPERVRSIKQRLDRLMREENQNVYGVGFPASRYRHVAERIDPNAHVLDAACGQGEGSLVLAQRCRRVDGVDLNPDYVRRAQERFGEWKNLHFHADDAQCYTQAEGAVDVVVSMHTMEHVPNDRAFLGNVRKNLKAGGELFLEVPLLMPRPLREPLYPFHDREYLLAPLRELVVAEGFEILAELGVNRGAYVEVSEAREAVQLHCRAA